MEFEQLGESWKQWHGTTPVAPAEALQQVQQRAGQLRRVVRRRDRVEIGIALLMLPLFGWLAFVGRTEVSQIGAAIIAIACLVIPIRLRAARRAEPDAGQPLLSRLREELAQVEAQQRADARAKRDKRRQRVGTLAEAAGLLIWDETTLAGLFQILATLRETPDPVAVYVYVPLRGSARWSVRSRPHVAGVWVVRAWTSPFSDTRATRGSLLSSRASASLISTANPSSACSSSSSTRIR